MGIWKINYISDVFSLHNGFFKFQLKVMKTICQREVVTGSLILLKSTLSSIPTYFLSLHDFGKGGS